MITRKQRRKEQRKGLTPGEKNNDDQKPEEEKSGSNENVLKQTEKPFLIKTTNLGTRPLFYSDLIISITRRRDSI